jgi:hypothetical protein
MKNLRKINAQVGRREKTEYHLSCKTGRYDEFNPVEPRLLENITHRCLGSISYLDSKINKDRYTDGTQKEESHFLSRKKSEGQKPGRPLSLSLHLKMTHSGNFICKYGLSTGIPWYKMK